MGPINSEQHAAECLLLTFWANKKGRMAGKIDLIKDYEELWIEYIY